MIPATTYVVTCATGEIGQEIAKLLAPKHDLILVGRSSAKMYKLFTLLSETYKDRHFTSCLVDYTDPESVKKYARVIQDKKVSGIVVITPRPAIELLDDEPKWLNTLQSCFTGPCSVVKATVPSLTEKGSIVAISGITSVQLAPSYAGPSVIRRMWSAYTKGLSHELGPKQFRVNTVSPGTVLTQHHIQRIQKKAEESDKTFEQQLKIEVADTPLKAYATTLDVAKAVKFFLSDKSSHITGTNLLVDGGITKAF